MSAWVAYVLGFLTPVALVAVGMWLDSRKSDRGCDLCQGAAPAREIGCTRVCDECLDEATHLLTVEGWEIFPPSRRHAPSAGESR